MMHKIAQRSPAEIECPDILNRVNIGNRIVPSKVVIREYVCTFTFDNNNSNFVRKLFFESMIPSDNTNNTQKKYAFLIDDILQMW